MKRIAICLCLSLASLLCGAKEITILPQFAVGDTIRYRATAQVISHHENDSLVSVVKLLPELIVEEKDDIGFLLSASNKLESLSYDSSDPEAKDALSDKTDEINDIIASVKLRIQLDQDCRPDSILNMAEVKESMLNAIIGMFAKEQGVDIEGSAEWKMDTEPLLIGAVNMICTTKHLLEEQFCNIPYFNFTGIPLKSGKIPVSMVLTDELQKMCPDLKELKMEVNQFVNTMELNMSEEDGFYCIRVEGKEGSAEVEAELLYAGGILSHGFLSVKAESETEKLFSNFIIDGIR